MRINRTYHCDGFYICHSGRAAEDTNIGWEWRLQTGLTSLPYKYYGQENGDKSKAVMRKCVTVESGETRI